MFSIFCLRSEKFLAEILIHIRNFLVQLSKQRSKNVYITTNDLDSPKMSLHCVSEKLDSVKKSSKKWTFQNIFKDLKETCFSPNRERCPKFEQGIEKIAAHFQVSRLSFKTNEIVIRILIFRRGSGTWFSKCSSVST